MTGLTDVTCSGRLSLELRSSLLSLLLSWSDSDPGWSLPGPPATISPSVEHRESQRERERRELCHVSPEHSYLYSNRTDPEHVSGLEKFSLASCDTLHLFALEMTEENFGKNYTES